MAEGKISYRAKNETACPVCDNTFRREELLTGGGRMNAGDLTDELHRIYLPTQRYGEVYPLILRSLHRSISRTLKRTFFEFSRNHTKHRVPHFLSLGRRAVVKAVWDVDNKLADVSNSFSLF